MKDINETNVWKPDEARFSFFRAPITNKVPSRTMGLREAGTYIVSLQAKEATEQVRQAETPQHVRRVKNRLLDYVTFGGVFSRCEDSGLLAASGLVCLDFDHLGDMDQLCHTKSILLADPYFETELLFISPLGRRGEVGDAHRPGPMRLPHLVQGHKQLPEADLRTDG